MMPAALPLPPIHARDDTHGDDADPLCALPRSPAAAAHSRPSSPVPAAASSRAHKSSRRLPPADAWSSPSCSYLDLRCDDSNHVAHSSAAESAAVAPPPPPARAPPAPAPSALVTFLAELADLAADLDPPALTFASPFASLASLIAYLMVAILGQFATLALVLVTWSHRRRYCSRRRPNGKRLRYRRHRVDVADVTAMGAPDTLWMAERDPPATAEGIDAGAARPDAPAPAAALPSPLAVPSPIAVDELKIVRGCECGRCHARIA
ncbi:hypothetical protein AMAG_06887 [Allomyces macrogynus ATCC 38327]|uniref:Uncharacterized protein n=1 Tax=Allomyces macrogynus (strain ATCC 38327) TaxID=578462 RepID=A0A0L0SFI8_ALLM3|nr:hypothetical protein AMAG_06887 [Allomyces macrogynus ATCC 38327]|eukprot:KNE61135.1 hypothetical protein AMAG_06887 [Allomyces macrogynus ATCC 38327]